MSLDKSVLTYTLEREDGLPWKNITDGCTVYTDKDKAYLAALNVSDSNYGATIRVVENVRNPLCLITARDIKLWEGW